jgi:DNA-binding transcriptional regulator PaaX
MYRVRAEERMARREVSGQSMSRVGEYWETLTFGGAEITESVKVKVRECVLHGECRESVWPAESPHVQCLSQERK